MSESGRELGARPRSRVAGRVRRRIRRLMHHAAIDGGEVSLVSQVALDEVPPATENQLLQEDFDEPPPVYEEVS